LRGGVTTLACGIDFQGGVDMLPVRIAIVASLLFAAFGPNPAAADGAVAVGLPADVAKDGVSIGSIINSATADSAKAEALKQCKTPPKRTVSNTVPTTKTWQLCAVVAGFQNQCFAYAFDPQDGTPGFGWAVDDDGRGAEKQALANCEKTAGPKRRAACVIVKTGCDGTAK
jgi:hypothetical protein